MIQKYPQNTALLVGYANFLSNSQKYDEAISTYNESIQIYDRLLNSYVSKAMIHQFKKPNASESEKLARKVL
jgi:hypothetical protein